MLNQILKDTLTETTKRLLKAILDLPRYQEETCGIVTYIETVSNIQDLKSLTGDISLKDVLKVFEKESGISKEDFEEFLTNYKNNLKGRR